jgi:LPS O-antigen subunit length determinant protein (WzzB/FepE family)
LIILIGVLSIVIFLLLVFFWRRFWTSDMMLSEPRFKATPGGIPAAVATRYILKNAATLDRMLLYKIMESTLKKHN